MSTTLVEKSLTIPWYKVISNTMKTGIYPPYTPDILTHIYCYINDFVTAVQGMSERQDRVFDDTVQVIKWLFPSLMVKVKFLVNVNKIQAGEFIWPCTKELLEWSMNKEAVTVSLLYLNHYEILTLIYFPDSKLHMSWNFLDQLIGKLFSMHIMVPGEVSRL